MNYGEFVKNVTADVNQESKVASEALVKDVLNSTVNVLTASVAKGDKVQIPGLGSFEGSKRAARDGRNPLTGETIHIAETTVPKFKAAKAFKEMLK